MRVLIICSFVTRSFFFWGMFPPSLTHSTIDIVGDTLKSEPLGFLLVFLRCFSFVIRPFFLTPFWLCLGLFLSFFFFFTVIVFFFVVVVVPCRGATTFAFFCNVFFFPVDSTQGMAI